jgi:hypothetical protein
MVFTIITIQQRKEPMKHIRAVILLITLLLPLLAFSAEKGDGTNLFVNFSFANHMDHHYRFFLSGNTDYWGKVSGSDGGLYSSTRYSLGSFYRFGIWDPFLTRNEYWYGQVGFEIGNIHGWYDQKDKPILSGTFASKLYAGNVHDKTIVCFERREVSEYDWIFETNGRIDFVQTSGSSLNQIVLKEYVSKWYNYSNSRLYLGSMQRWVGAHQFWVGPLLGIGFGINYQLMLEFQYLWYQDDGRTHYKEFHPRSRQFSFGMNLQL